MCSHWDTYIYRHPQPPPFQPPGFTGFFISPAKNRGDVGTWGQIQEPSLNQWLGRRSCPPTPGDTRGQKRGHTPPPTPDPTQANTPQAPAGAAFNGFRRLNRPDLARAFPACRTSNRARCNHHKQNGGPNPKPAPGTGQDRGSRSRNRVKNRVRIEHVTPRKPRTARL